MKNLLSNFHPLLAQSDLNDVFGKVTPQGGVNSGDVGLGLSRLLVVSIQLVLFLAGLALAGYLFYGAFLWISSAGEEEKLKKARETMTQAVIGIIMFIVSITLFVVVAGNMLNIVTIENGNIIFNLPTLGDTEEQQQQRPLPPPGGNF